jgi:putative FmdB family regulatory protein
MVYEYKCTPCSHIFDAKQSMKDPVGASCPKCGTESKERIITGGSGFLLQGGGWYRDLYSKTSQSKSD